MSKQNAFLASIFVQVVFFVFCIVLIIVLDSKLVLPGRRALSSVETMSHLVVHQKAANEILEESLALDCNAMDLNNISVKIIRLKIAYIHWQYM